MRAVLTNLGSAGDVQPLLALAAELGRHGHEPVLALAPFFRRRVEAAGLEFFAVGPEIDLREIDRRDVAALMEGADPLEVMERALALLDSMLPVMFGDLERACDGADLLVGGHLQPVARMLHELTQIPFASVQVNHFGGRRSAGERRALGNVVNAFRRRHGLPPLEDPLHSDSNSPQLALYAMSRHLGIATASWASHFHLTGFFFLDEEEWRPDEELEVFLAAGEPPVVVSFSSLAVADPGEMTRQIVEAVRRAGRRAVLQSGWSGLGEGDLPPEILTVGYVPHSYLFPRAACVVHHGGGQTTAAVLRAGVPSIVVPFIRDQPVWARLVHDLGVAGPVVSGSQLTGERLGGAISATLDDPGYARAAARLGEKVRAEPGVRYARELVERLVRDVGLSGAAGGEDTARGTRGIESRSGRLARVATVRRRGRGERRAALRGRRRGGSTPATGEGPAVTSQEEG